MSKRQYYYDKLDLKHYEIRPKGKNLKIADIEQLLVKYVKGTNACLEKFVRDDHYERFARMYAIDKKQVASRTAEARRMYDECIDKTLLPDCYQRRIIDILKGRIQAVLPGAAQRLVIADYITEHPDQDDNQVAQSLYDLIVNQKQYQVKAPNAQVVGNVRRQMQKGADGRLSLPPIEPEFGDRFCFSHGDAVMSTVRRQGKQIVFKSGYKGKTYEIFFDIPDKDRYQHGKVTLPDISLYTDENGRERVMFSFSVRHSAPVPYDSLCSLGVDVGEVYPFVCAVVGSHWHSQGIYPRKEILDLVDKMGDLSFQIAVLGLKIRQDSVEGRRNLHGESFLSRVGVLEVECSRLKEKRSRLKKEIAHQVAHRVCELALQCHAQVVLEKLNWSDPKHSFYHSLIHDAITNRCRSLGVPVVVVSARGSSAWSPENGSVLSQGITHGVAASGVSCERSSWRSVDRLSGVRDVSLRREVSRRTGVDVERVGFGEVVAARSVRKPKRGARDRLSGRVRDHDYVSPLNLGVRGEAARYGHHVLRVRMVESVFVRLKFVKSCRGELTLTAPVSEVPSGVVPGSFSLVGPYWSSSDWSSQQGSPVPALGTPVAHKNKKQDKK